jgi:hypothetical protein
MKEEKKSVPVGPVWSQADFVARKGEFANLLGSEWELTGGWRTTVPNEESVVEFKRKVHNYQPGPPAQPYGMMGPGGPQNPGSPEGQGYPQNPGFNPGFNPGQGGDYTNQDQGYPQNPGFNPGQGGNYTTPGQGYPQNFGQGGNYTTPGQGYPQNFGQGGNYTTPGQGYPQNFGQGAIFIPSQGGPFTTPESYGRPPHMGGGPAPMGSHPSRGGNTLPKSHHGGPHGHW